MPIVASVSSPGDNTKTIGSVYVQGKTTGALAAQIVCMDFEKGKKTVACVPNLATRNHVESVEMFAQGCAKRGVEFLKTYIMAFSVESEWKTAERILNEHPDIGGIYVGSNNAPVLCKYFESKGLAGKVRIVGHDLYPEIAECIESGSLVATIFQNQYENTFRALIGLSEYIAGFKVGFEYYRHRPELVMESNLNAYTGLY